MGNKIQLSVIIPVYNTEKYLQRCVDSVLKNNDVGLEIILVDDGSTDSSPSICDSYSSRVPFVKTIHITNSGPASAKNRGIEIAQGEYIALTDSDDEVKPDMFVKMLETAKRHNADIVGCNYEERLSDGTIRQFSYSGKTLVVDRRGAFFNDTATTEIYTQCWTKIYRREMIVANDIRNIEGLKTDEDFIFNIHCLVHASTTCVVDQPLYTYSMLPSSLSKAYFSKRIDSYIDNRLLNFDITRRLVLTHSPANNLHAVFNRLYYSNELLGRIALFPEKYSDGRTKSVVGYMRRHILTVLRHHRKIGFSLVGSLMLLLPTKWYMSYRHSKI